jgi:hypothetical protein
LASLIARHIDTPEFYVNSRVLVTLASKVASSLAQRAMPSGTLKTQDVDAGKVVGANKPNR